MAERVRMLGGNHLVDTGPDKGTTIIIRLHTKEGGDEN
jgi:signal transduction histidine kinase